MIDIDDVTYIHDDLVRDADDSVDDLSFYRSISVFGDLDLFYLYASDWCLSDPR